jgi:general secretion pathway protein K
MADAFRPSETAEAIVRRWRVFCAAQRREVSELLVSLRSDRNASNSGFALVAVIWSLGLVSLLGAAVIVGARYRVRMTSNQAAVLVTAAAAESAVNLAIALSLSSTPQQMVKFPLRCQMPNGEQSTIGLEEETGKVDLNSARGEVLSHLFTALTYDQSAGMRIAAEILRFRDSALAGTAKDHPSGKPDRNENPRFTTIMQLDRIDGISPVVFRAALRFVTVRSGRADPDGDAASPAMRKLLSLDQAKPAPRPTRGIVTIRADVIGTDGSRFIREALVSLGPEDGRPFRILEWRHGDVEAEERIAGLTLEPTKQRRCFSIS